MSSTLVFGGTFDPVHRGHIESVNAVAKLLGDADVYLVPCQIPAHRPIPAASPGDRLRMLELATSGRDRIHVDDCELGREGTSYTFDTLLGYRRKVGEAGPLIFLMGLDSWVTLPEWHRWEELTDLAHLLIIKRPGVEREIPAVLAHFEASRKAQDLDELRHSPSGKVCFLSLEQIDVSATGLRDKVARGLSIEGDVNPRVIDHIRQNNLYSDTFPEGEVPDKRMEHKWKVKR